jgi:hypothetical protein
VVTRVFAVNIGLGALAVATVIEPGRISDVIALVGAVILAAWLLITLGRGRA